MKSMSLLFLKLGIVAFGGPAAHTAMLETEVVAKRNWLSADSFLELMSITNLIPGPNSSELVMAIGYRRYGMKGLFVAGISFLLPAMMMVIAITVSLSWFDFNLLTNIGVALTPVIAIIILKALLNLIKKQDMDVKGITILVAALILKYFNVDEFLIIGFGALMFSIWNHLGTKLYSVEPFSLGMLTLAFLKIGATLYGSGYVLLSYLETTFVHQLGWLTYPQIIQAFTIGELTPGPVFTTATSVGTMLGGIPGGILATLGIFAPSFLLMILVMPISHRLLANVWIKQALKGIAFASLGLMFYVALTLVSQSMGSVSLIIIFIVSVIAVLRFKVNTLYLIIGMPFLYSMLQLIGG